jgi:hypothetical protein
MGPALTDKRPLPEGFVPVQVSRRTMGTEYTGVRREVAEAAYVEYAAQYGTSQSFKRLHERGGFGIEELLSLLTERLLRG